MSLDTNLQACHSILNALLNCTLPTHFIVSFISKGKGKSWSTKLGLDAYKFFIKYYEGLHILEISPQALLSFYFLFHFESTYYDLSKC